MNNTLARLSKLKDERNKILQSTSKEQRVKSMESLLNNLDEYGKKNYPFLLDNWKGEDK